MRIFIDTPSILWAGMMAGKDREGFEAVNPDDPDKKVWVNTAAYGFENTLTSISAFLDRHALAPKDVVFCREGMRPTQSRRSRVKSINYKGGRGKRPLRAYEEYSAAQELLVDFFKELGSSFCIQNEVEGDDICAYLCSKVEDDAIVFTRDGDLARLVGTNPKGFKISVGNNDWMNANPYGPFPNDLITLYKALVGDTNDSIPGVRGLGDGTFLKLLGKYGVDGLYQIEKLIVERKLAALNEQADGCRMLKQIVDAEEQAINSYTLALLYPGDVNTPRNPLEWTFGMVRDLRETDDHRFKKWYGTRVLVHGGNFKEVVNWARRQRTDWVSLDLETTTPPESDEWLEARKTRDQEDKGVDVYASEIVSCGLTFGDNQQHTLYLTHRHLPEAGVQQLTLAQLTGAIQHLTRGRQVVCHNAGGFELPVLRNHVAFEGDQLGFLPNVHCTKLMANYVNENKPSGLKPSAKAYLGYDQQTYQEVTGGKKMDELTASHVFHYGTDDTIVTSALYNHFTLQLMLEDTWEVYKEVEIEPMYLQAVAFLEGVPISLERMRELEQADDARFATAWAVLRDYLIEAGWPGTKLPEYSIDSSAADFKEAFEIVNGTELDTKVRKLDRLAEAMEEQGDGTMAQMLRRLADGDAHHFNEYVRAHFKGEPQINLNSYKQLQRLMYESLALPVRVRKPPTEAMLAKGIYEGSAQTDELAINLALHFDKGGKRPDVLEALLDLKSVETRRKLYYRPYPGMPHWKHGGDTIIHASFNQCATVTRRYSCSGPNLQQLPKKDEGLVFREIILPHHKDAVVVSMDFSGQELRLMAEESRDPVMLACYVGENLKDMHSLTAASISAMAAGRRVTYEQVYEGDDAGDPFFKKLRALGKKLNFTVQYGAMAKKVGYTLLVEEEVAEQMLEARSALFHVSEQWKKDYIEQCRAQGYATTRLGARRHLRDAFDSDDFMVAGKAERQGPNFKIQGSGAEQTKLAMAQMWRDRIFEKFDAVPYGPVHDEYVASCAVADLVPFIQEMHACMVRPYAGMTVPIISSISFGPNFGQQIEIGEQPVESAINKGLEKLGLLLTQAA